jgi:hypothetical protein
MNKRTSLILTLALAAVISACGEEGSGVPKECTGTFDLANANGSSVPAVVSEPGSPTTVTLLNGKLTIQPSGAFEEVLQFRLVPSAGAQFTTVKTSGTVTFSRLTPASPKRTVTFKPRSGEVYAGTAYAGISYTKGTAWGSISMGFSQPWISTSQGPNGPTFTGLPQCF